MSRALLRIGVAAAVEDCLTTALDVNDLFVTSLGRGAAPALKGIADIYGLQKEPPRRSRWRSVVSSVLSLAVDEETIGSNPALGVTRQRRTKASRRDARARAGETIKALTRDQRNTFLATAEHEEPEAFPAFMLMTLGGLRLGEALGLK